MSDTLQKEKLFTHMGFWQNYVQCSFSGCDHTFGKHDGQDFECSESGCTCTSFESPSV